MQLTDITVVLLTRNEAANIGRTLEALSWAPRVVVVDSESEDDTRRIAASFPRVNVHERRFDTHAGQWNFAVSQTGITTTWVLALDADYLVRPRFVEELEALDPAASTVGYRARFIYCVQGQPLRGSLYPPVTVLFRRERGHYVQDGHTQRLHIEGAVQDLKTPLLHDDRKPLAQWLGSQGRYARLEARKLRRSSFAELGWAGRARRLVFLSPPAMLCYCLFIKANLLDGRAGLFYALQRTLFELLLSLYLVAGSEELAAD